MAVKSCRDGLPTCLQLSSKIKALLIFFLSYRTHILQIYEENQDTRKVWVLNHYLRSNWGVAQAALGGQCGIRNRDTLGGRSQCCLWHCCFPTREKEGMEQEGRNPGEPLWGAVPTQHNTEQQGAVRCGTVRSEPWWEAGRRKLDLNTIFSCSPSSLVQ